jgi:3-methyladenine DNA glycosylase AlkD
MLRAEAIIKEVKKKANKKKAVLLQRFFKTGPGQYSEGDIFYGLTVPQSRIIAKKYQDLNLVEIKKLLISPVHEIRLIALLILVEQFKTGDVIKQRIVTDFYLENTKYINNWDLVDLTAHKILGAWLLNRPTKKLLALANSANLWERRIAVIASFAHIQNHDFKTTLTLAKKLLHDEHDLMHKAVGWMLREMGKRSISELKTFLNQYSRTMPRTMLRYAIEKLPERERQAYLKN